MKFCQKCHHWDDSGFDTGRFPIGLIGSSQIQVVLLQVYQGLFLDTSVLTV